jgi:hypothetical protein
MSFACAAYSASPDLSRARAIAARLPVRVRIDGPVHRFDSHPDPHDARDRDRGHDDDDHGPSAWGLTRTLADGHVVRFSLLAPPDSRRPRLLGWIALAVLGVITGLAYLAVAVAGGAVFLLLALRLWRSRAGDSPDKAEAVGREAALYDVRAEAKPARDLFAYSILYLMILFATLLAETLPASPIVCPSCA